MHSGDENCDNHKMNASEDECNDTYAQCTHWRNKKKWKESNKYRYKYKIQITKVQMQMLMQMQMQYKENK